MIQQLLFCFVGLQLNFQAAPQPPSFIEQSIASAKETIAREPGKAEGYNELAMALVRKQRETGDALFLTQAEEAIAKSLKLNPANFDGRKARVALRLSQHRYEDALEEAQALNKQTPDDNPIYGFIFDAQAALGNYPAAEKAVQLMLDLRSVNGPGMERGALMRELIGYPEAALDWWNSALHLVSDRDREERAYINTQTARVYREAGKYDLAAQTAREALNLEPGYPAALVEMARIDMERNSAKTAVELLQARLKEGSDVESLYWLAQAYELSADAQNAGAAYAAFEGEARAQSSSPHNANALLIAYWSGHGKVPEAVALGKQSLARRHDLFTRSAYAMALFRNGQTAEALREIRQALETGIRDAPLYFDAGTIAKQEKDNAAALIYFRTAFEINAVGPVAAESLKEMAALAAQASPVGAQK